MAGQLYLRIASAVGLLALAFVFVGLDPFLGAPTADTTPGFSVDRSLKGDRLPVLNSATFSAPDWRSEFGSQPSTGPHAQMLVGCDPAFSAISSPPATNVYRRCLA